MIQTPLRNHDFDGRRLTRRELRAFMLEIREMLDRIFEELVILDLEGNQLRERICDLHEKINGLKVAPLGKTTQSGR